MTFDDLLKLLSTQGFPATVAIFVLWRLDARLREITTALSTLHLELARLRTHLTPPS